MTKKDEVVQILEELSVLMELADENSFKIRAIQNGARVLDKMDVDLVSAMTDGSLVGIRGLGKGLLEIVREYLETGDVTEYRTLKAQVPEGVLSLTNLRGVGAKKAKQLHEKLGIGSIGELEYACHENRLLELKGFGEKTQASILAAIQTWQAAQGKCLQHVATRISEQLVTTCIELGATRAQSAGALRRRAEIVEEIVVLSAGLDAKQLQQHFGLMPENGVLNVVHDGIRVRICLCTDTEFESRLFLESGNDEFIAAFKQRFDVDVAASEKEIFESNGLQWIEAELRESASILDLAQKKNIPTLVENSDMHGMLHIHSTWSDGANSVREMALESKRLGFSYVALCDHSKTAVYANGLSVDRVHQQHREIDALNDEGLGISILKGIESDILSDGSLDYDDEILEMFDVVVASVHSAFNLSAEVQTQRIIRAIRNPYTTILGHPTGRLLLARPGYELDIERILQAAAETGTVIELNASPRRLDLDWRWHRRAVELGVSLAINPDSHQTTTLSEVFIGVGIARKGMLRKQDVVNTMTEKEFRQFAAELRESKMG